jgi:outer membrane protein assembly factor BamE (lipoprotein component of BamABCDE complex)
MKKIALLVTLAIALTAAGAGYYIWPRQATQFSPGFRRKAYSQLPFRSSAETVRRILGAPLAQRTFVARERWLYCLQEPQSIVTNPGVVIDESEQPLSCPEIEFDQGRHVSAISGWPDVDPSSLVGRDPPAVEARLGKPLLVRNGGRYTVWYYSGPAKTNARYEQFTVTFDEHGRVVDKNATWIAD